LTNFILLAPERVVVVGRRRGTAAECPADAPQPHAPKAHARQHVVDVIQKDCINVVNNNINTRLI
jgi:hypothetical protein